MKKFDIIVVGELNVDLIFDGISMFPELGKEILADEMDLVLGSSSAILASNLASLGVCTAFVGKLGKDDFGDFVIECLESKGVHIDYVMQDPQFKTGASIILNYPQDRAVVTHKGAMDELTVKDITGELVDKAQHLHLSSYYLQDGIRKDCAQMFKMAHNHGLTTSFDTNWDPSEQWGDEVFDVLSHVDVFLPNREEALRISKETAIDSALNKLASYAKTVAIKLGKEGAVVNRNGEILKVDAFEVSPVDAVGAGDSFNSGFLYKYLRKSPLHECVEFGNACGALSVTKAGGTAAFQNPAQIENDLQACISYETNLRS